MNKIKKSSFFYFLTVMLLVLNAPKVINSQDLGKIKKIYIPENKSLTQTFFTWNSEDIFEYTDRNEFTSVGNNKSSLGAIFKIIFKLNNPGYVNIKIYNKSGKVIEELANSTFAAGSHEIMLNLSKLEKGKYFYSLITGEYSETKEIITK